MKLTVWVDKGGNGVRLRRPEEIRDAKQVIIRDEFGQALMVLIQQAPDRIWLSKKGDRDFSDAVRVLGIEDIEVQVVQRNARKDIKFPTVT